MATSVGVAPEAPLVTDAAAAIDGEGTYWVYYDGLDAYEWEASLTGVVRDVHGLAKLESFTSRFDENPSPIHMTTRTYRAGTIVEAEAVPGDIVRVTLWDRAAGADRALDPDATDELVASYDLEAW